jgi:hypothetical protein
VVERVRRLCCVAKKNIYKNPANSRVIKFYFEHRFEGNYIKLNWEKENQKKKNNTRTIIHFFSLVNIYKKRICGKGKFIRLGFGQVFIVV